MARDPFQSHLRDENTLIRILTEIITGETIDLRDAIRRCAFLMSRLGNITEHPSRALLRAALANSPHPMAGHFSERLGRPDQPDEVGWATARHIEWLETEQKQALDDLLIDEGDTGQ